MIPDIGLMIGLYILLRYAEMAKNGGVAMKVLCVLFTLVNLALIFSVLMSGRNAPTL